MKHYCIIGASAAGLAALEKIRRVDKVSKIFLISEERVFPYSRVLLNLLIEDRVKEDQLFMKPKDFFDSLNVKLLFGIRAEGIDTKRGKVYLSNGKCLSYDSLLIATGASAFVPDMVIEDPDRVVCLRNLTDVLKLKKLLKHSERAVVIGGGPVGLKVCLSLRKRGMDVILVEMQDRILSNVLDLFVSRWVEELLEGIGVSILNSTKVTKILKKGKKLKLITQNEDSLECDFVVISAGVKPNSDLLKDAGTFVHSSGGIKVNEYMETGIENIYAAGDVVAANDLVHKKFMLHPIWPVAVEQGAMAGLNMAGIKVSYRGAVMHNVFQVKNLPIVSAGICNPTGEGFRVLKFEAKGKGIYRKLVMRDDFIVGMVWVGNPEEAGTIVNFIKQQKRAIDFEKITFNRGSYERGYNRFRKMYWL